MRTSLIGLAFLAIAVFGVGYLVGQVRGIAAGSAATNGPVVLRGFTDTNQPTTFTFRPLSTQGGAKHADGTITAVNGDTITVQADNDSGNPNEYTSVTTIVLTNSTTYQGTGGKSAIKAGSHIIAEGTVSSDGKTLTATSVGVGGPGGHGNCPHGSAPSGSTPGTSTSSLRA